MWLELTQHGDLPVPDGVLGQIREATRSAHPQETCGLLLGRDGHITEVLPATNVHPTPQSHFEIDPQALIDAHRAERAGGPEVLGYFHSHPTGDPRPSPTDQAMAAHDGRVWAISAGDDVTFWRDDPDGFHPLSYVVVDD